MVRAQAHKLRREQAYIVEEGRKNKEHFQQLSAISGNLPGVALLNAGQTSIPAQSDEEFAVPTDSSALYNEVKSVVRPYGLYDRDHQCVFDSLIEILGDLPLGPNATPADALALAAFFGIIYSMVSCTKALPNFANLTNSGTSGSHHSKLGKHPNTVVADAAHFIIIPDEGLRASAQQLAAKPEKLHLAVLFLVLLFKQKRPSALVVDVAMSVFSNMDGTDITLSSSLKAPLFPLAHYIPYVKAANPSPLSGNGDPIVTLSTDGRVVVEDAIYILVGFCQLGLILTPEQDSSAGSVIPSVDCHAPFVIVPKSTQVEPSKLCAACTLQMEPFKHFRFLHIPSAGLVAADLRTAAAVHVHKDGRTEFSADALVWDVRLEKTIRVAKQKFEANIFDLHALMPLSHPQLSALLPENQASHGNFDENRNHGGHRSKGNFNAPFPVCRDVYVKNNGFEVATVLERASSYVVNNSSRVVSAVVGGKLLYAARRDDGSLFWSKKMSNHAFDLFDVVS